MAGWGEGSITSLDQEGSALIPALCFPTLREAAHAVSSRFLPFVEVQSCIPWFSSSAENRSVFLEWKLQGNPISSSRFASCPRGLTESYQVSVGNKDRAPLSQIHSNNLRLLKSKILFAWLPVMLGRNYHPWQWEKWGKGVNCLAGLCTEACCTHCFRQDTKPRAHLQTPAGPPGSSGIVSSWVYFGLWRCCSGSTNLWIDDQQC